MNGSLNETNMVGDKNETPQDNALVLPSDAYINKNEPINSPVVEADADKTTETPEISEKTEPTVKDKDFPDIIPAIEEIATMITKTEAMIQDLETQKTSVEDKIIALNETKADIVNRLATAGQVLIGLKSGKTYFSDMKNYVEANNRK